MKFNRNTRRILIFKYAIAMVIVAALLTAIALPAVAQHATTDTTIIRNPDTLIIKTQPGMAHTQTDSRHDAITKNISRATVGTVAHHTVDPLIPRDTLAIISGYPRTIYSRPISWTYSDPWWHGMWINTAVLSGAFVGTLLVLETLPEDATSWNRAEIQNVPFYKRWHRNVFELGPEWDHDHFIFNYILHPYAGAAYFMCARTCGFNFWQSMLYSAMVSTFGWEFGIEACMERPSYQDLLITPIIGSLIGEGMYRLKHIIVNNNHEILGSSLLGHITTFLLDPVNEVVGALRPGTCRNIGPGCLSSQPLLIPSPAPGVSSAVGLSVSATF